MSFSASTRLFSSAMVSFRVKSCEGDHLKTSFANFGFNWFIRFLRKQLLKKMYATNGKPMGR